MVRDGVVRRITKEGKGTRPPHEHGEKVAVHVQVRGDFRHV